MQMQLLFAVMLAGPGFDRSKTRPSISERPFARSGFASSDQSKANLRWTVEASSILFCNRQFLSDIKHNLMHCHMKPLLK